MENLKKSHKLRNALLIIALSIVVLLIALAVTVFCVWTNEIKTINSIQTLSLSDDQGNKPVYYMEYENNYYLDELINEGGVTCSEDLINFATSKISHGLYCMNMKPGDIKMGCTTFTAKTGTGENIFARNYDYNRDAVCVLKTPAVNDRHATLSMVDLSKLDIKVPENELTLIQKLTMLAAPYAPMDGMNDAGLSVSILTSRQGADPIDTKSTAVGTNLNTEKLDLTVTSFVRYILDKCTTVDEAVEFAKKIDIHEFSFSSMHYAVADKTGKSAVIE